MNGFKKCVNSHFYKEDLNACPYCQPNQNQNQAQQNSSGDLDKTIIPGAGNFSDNSKTEVFSNDSSGEKTKVFGGGNSSASPIQDFGRTYIGGVTNNESAGSSSEVFTTEPRSTRRIVGWLISYTLDPMGVDYRIYEGSNTIGKSPDNTISINKDSTISSQHVNILYKKGKFYMKDKMTTNGTFLNNEELEVEQAYEITDGDVIKMGNTIFKFKTCD